MYVQIISNTPRTELEHVITHLPKSIKGFWATLLFTNKSRAEQKPLTLENGYNCVKSVVDDLWHPMSAKCMHSYQGWNKSHI